MFTQSIDEQESESLHKMYNDLKDSEAKLVSMLSDIELHEKETIKVTVKFLFFFFNEVLLYYLMPQKNT